MKSTLINKAQAAGAQVAQHTPGPWFIEGDAIWCYDTREKCQRVCIPCDMLDGTFNARLIAAAPELLEALKVLVEQFDAYRKNWRGDSKGWVDRIGLPEQLEQARKAIERAEGKL